MDHLAEHARLDAKVDPGSLVSAPTLPADRIETLDVIRGFAVLGILVMNVQSFSMIGAAYLNPTAAGQHEGTNYLVWYVSHLLADSKFMSIFSMLFGAGIVMMAQRSVDRGRRPGPLHYRRSLGLLFIGLAHAYILWFGDILVPYAVCGALLFPLWRWPSRWLFVASAALILIGAAIIALFGISMMFLSEAELSEVMASWRPSADLIRQEVDAYHGPWTGQLKHRAESAFMMETFLLLTMIGWHVGGLMLLGMALFKSGFFSGDRSRRELVGLMMMGACVGFPLIALGIYWNEQAGWTLKQSMFYGTLPNYFGSTFVALAYVAALGLLMKGSMRKPLTKVLAPVGRMALTNYLMQTVICTTIFYGHGFGLYATLNRLEQLGVVVSVWAFQIALSNLWMRKFRFGPIEYLWRAATYGHLVQFRRFSSPARTSDG